MATLQQAFDLYQGSKEGGSTGAKNLRYRTQAAVQKAAVAILAEDPTTPAREAWGVSVTQNPVAATEPIWVGVSSNVAIVDKWAADPTGGTVTDGDIEFTVNSVISALYPLT